MAEGGLDSTKRINTMKEFASHELQNNFNIWFAVFILLVNDI